MRFLVMVVAKKEFDPANPPKPEEFVAMQEYNEKAIKAGVLLAAEGLAPSSKGARVILEGKQPTVLDGPFTESKELVAGFCIIKVDSLAEAVKWVKGAPFTSKNGESYVEIRKLMDVEDFGAGFVPNDEVAKVKFT